MSESTLQSIRAVRSLHDVLEHVDASTVVFLDIDNTLLTVSQEQDIGSVVAGVAGAAAKVKDAVNSLDDKDKKEL